VRDEFALGRLGPEEERRVRPALDAGVTDQQHERRSSTGRRTSGASRRG